jgi:hypothetical protein
MPRFRLPTVRFSRRSTGVMVVGLLVLSLGTAGAAVTAELHDGKTIQHAADQNPYTPLQIATPKPIHTGAAADPVSMPLSKRPKHLIDATLLVSARHAFTRHQLRAIGRVSGVHHTQTLSAGPGRIDGHHAFMIGVNPQSVRPWTPSRTAASNALWSSISRGEVTASFDMGHNVKLPLGKTVPVAGPRGVTPIRIGAFASVGMAGVDAVVSSLQAHQLGLEPRTGVLVSAPKADPLAVRKAVLGIVGKHARAEVLREVVVTRDVGEFLTRAQINGFLHAAASRVGAPYVWGATGPDAFDCSGLVQWSFAKVGIRMPRVAQEQFFTGPHVKYADARPGDLLFWHYDPTDRTAVDHVAIYVGNGQMIEAPHTGELVKLVPVPLAHLAGVVRVDPTLAAQIA